MADRSVGWTKQASRTRLSVRIAINRYQMLLNK